MQHAELEKMADFLFIKFLNFVSTDFCPALKKTNTFKPKSIEILEKKYFEPLYLVA